MNRKLKLFFIPLITLVCFLGFMNHSYAYNQTYQAIINESNDGYSATITQYSKATSQDISNYNSASKDYDNWVNLSPTDSSASNSFATYGFKFHKDISSIYYNGFSNANNGSIMNMYYDEGNIGSGSTTAKAVNINISKEGIIDDVNSFTQEINGTDIYRKRYKIANVAGQNDILITDYVINNSLLQKLLSSSNYFMNGNTTSGSVSIRISNVMRTDYGDNLDTLAKFLRVNGTNLPASDRGFNTNEKVNYNEKDASFLPIASVANLYDNIISIPTGNYYGREVYVRHFDSATGKLINGIGSNEQVIIGKNGEKSLAQRVNSDVSDFDYSEYYRYNSNCQMEISKSLVINADGKKYTYLGANVSTVNTIDEAKEVASLKQSNYFNTYDVKYKTQTYENDSDTTTITTKVSNSDDITIVDFYYNVSDMQDVSAKISSDTNIWANSGEIADCTTTYIPSGEYLKPYIEAPKYILKDLKYKKAIKDGNIVYQVDKFNVYKLSGGVIKNSSGVRDDDRNITGNIIGFDHTSLISDPSNEIYLNFTGNLSINDELEQKVKAEYIGRMPTDGDIEIALGSKSASNDFNTSLQVGQDKVNGLRYVQGGAIYNTYSVLDKTEEYAFEIDTNNQHFVNVYTPVTLNSPTIVSDATNHTDASDNGAIIEAGANFTITIPCGYSDFTYYQGASNTSKYVNRYFVMFDFDILYNGELKPKGELIEVTNYTENGATFTAKVYENKGLVGDDISATSKVLVFAVASNLPSEALLSEIVDVERKIEVEKDPAYLDSNRKYVNDTGSNLITFSSICDEFSELKSSHPDTLIGATMYSDAFYVAKRTLTLRSAARIYDFRITDCNDLAFKNVFREANSGSNVNEKTGISYFSGIRRLYIYSKSYQTIIDRDNININGTKTKTILPLGPYKHSTATYLSAPKMGYRISFDVKTAGYYIANISDEKSIQITPSYYYISKDGTELIEDIDLYYKNESGKYQAFAGSNYTIYFRPNDPYRNIEFNSNRMSDQLEPLNIASSDGYFTLTDKMMSVSDTLYNQAWYGEFKLPNSTIAVRSGDSIRNELKDGYIGVKFDIKCIEYDDAGMVTISYNQNDKSASNNSNTSQWDYEGYLGFSNIGQQISESNPLRLQLENGVWKIDSNEVYNFIKGTVVLYDLDNRAANDFE
ncbi:MAG: hypothetical protein Q4D02_00090 [Clostridia bacterium]|nr:hypothetical protein [Clostridia bacterium]